MVGIRVAFWVATAASLLWAPLKVASHIPPYHAYNGNSDLLFGTFAQWDADWFLHIGAAGYDSRQSTAFFPLYPLVLRAAGDVVRAPLVGAVLVSLAAAAASGWALWRLGRPLLGPDAAWTAILFVALYPIAYVFTAPYSDALFLALATGSFLAASRGRSVTAGVLGGLAVATRLIGLALVPALIVLLWPRTRRQLPRLLPVALLPAAIGCYALYLQHRFGDARVFERVQGVYWHRYTPTLGPLGGLWDSFLAGWRGLGEIALHIPRAQDHPMGFPNRDEWAIWNLVQLLLLVAAIWLTWYAWTRLGLAYGLYSAATLVIVLSSPAHVVPLVSFPRFVLGDFPLFLALAHMTENHPRARTAIAVGFGAIGAAAAVAFSRKLWIA